MSEKTNPAFSACWAILGSVMLTAGALLLRRAAGPSVVPSSTPAPQEN